MKGCEMTEAKREGFSTSDAGHPQEYPEDSNITRAMNWLQEPIAPSSAVDEAIFEKWCELDDLERKIRELKLLKPQSITEVDTQSKMLADLESKRSALLRFFDGSPDAAIAQAGQQQPEPSPAPASAEQVSPKQVADMPRQRKKRKTWRDAAWGYVVQVQREGRYRTCNALFNALEDKGSEQGAPIIKGSGDKHRGRLFVVEIGESCELKTFQNAWPEIREAAEGE